MPADTLALLRHIRRLASQAPPAPDSDAALLGRFLRDRDEDAFTALVRRHGPLVRRVCRRVLADSHAAEDAFQATFCVLARKAAAVRPPEALASWLHGVAYRVALKARAAAAHRQARETAAPDLDPPDPHLDPLDELSARELLGVVDEEVQRLPEAYRLPVVLCCLAGRTREEAARRLGWTEGAVKGRLERGRARLHSRVARRGLTLAAALTALEVARAGATAGMPARLAEATVRAALAFAAAQGAAGTGVSARVAMLTAGGLEGLTVSKVKFALLLAAALAFGGTGVLAHQALAGRQPEARPGGPPAGVANADGARPAVQVPAHTDSYGDPLPPGAIARLGTVRLRHPDGGPLAFTPDGKRLISHSPDSVRLWDVKTGRELRRVDGGTHGFLGVALSPDGKTLASGHEDGVRLWDSATGKELRAPAGADGFTTSVAFSPDGKRLATAHQAGVIMVWDLASGTKIGQFTDAFVYRLFFSPDGKTLAVAGWDGKQQVMQFWDAVQGKLLRQFPVDRDMKWSLTFSPDGKLLVSGGEDRAVQLWDATAGKELARLEGQEDEVFSAAFSPDGRTVASGSRDGTVRLWDVASRRERRRWKTQAYTATDLTFSPGGEILANSGPGGIIQLWDLASGRELRPGGGHVRAVQWLTFSPGGKGLVNVGDNQLGIWEPVTGREVRRAEGMTDEQGLALSPDGALLATYNVRDQGARLWDVTSGKEVCRFPAKPVTSGTFAPDGRMLALGQWDKLLLFDTATGKEVRRLEGQRVFGDMAFSPDGRTLLTANLLAVGTDHTVRLWEVATGKELWRLDMRAWDHLHIAFAPDGRTVAAVGGRYDPPSRKTEGVVLLWNAATGKELRRFTGHRDQVWGLAFAPDGRTLITGSWDRTIRFWETATGQERRAPLTAPAGVSRLALSADGRLLASIDQTAAALVWDLGNPYRQGGTRSRRLSSQELAMCWDDLGAGDAARAYQAVLRLAAAPDQAVALLRKRLRSVTAADPRRVAALVAGLNGDAFAEREKAEQDLLRLGFVAEPALRKALGGELSPEARRRVGNVLERLEGAEAVRATRALEALEQAGTPEARQLLKALAAGAPDARLTREAKAALERLTSAP